jgi:hypothetical protein
MGEKSNKYFLSLEKRNKAKTHIKMILENNNEKITDEVKVLKRVEDHFKKLFDHKSTKTAEDCSSFLRDYQVPKLSEEEKMKLDRPITKEECFEAFKNMGSSKTPGNDGLTKEFYQSMWKEINDELFNCLQMNFEVGSLSTTQKQIIITLIEKPGKDSRLLDSWRPISLINVDVKVCSRIMCNRLEEILPNIIHRDQFAFVKGRKIEELLLTLQDVIDLAKNKNISCLLFAADFEKAFDSIEHNFITAVLKHFNFGVNFIKWAQLLLMNNTCCIINNGKVTNFFPLNRGTKQGDPISPYLFILVIEVLATMIRKSDNISGFKVKCKEYRLLMFADDTTFLLEDEKSFSEVLNILEIFRQYSSLRINVKKSEAGWLVSYKKNDFIKQEGLKYIDFDSSGIKILGVYFTNNKQLDYKNNLERVLINFKTTLNIWRSRNLTLIGKIQILKSLALPKLYYVCSKKYISNDYIQSVESLMKDFIWNGRRPKIKHSTLIGDYLQGGLGLPDFKSQLIARNLHLLLQMKRDIDNNKYYTQIPGIYLKQLGGLSKIVSNFDHKRIPTSTPPFYKQILEQWANYTKSDLLEDPTVILNQPIWNNRYIQILKKAVFYEDIASHGINTIIDLCDDRGNFKWETVRQKGLKDKCYLKWAGLVHSIPNEWKKCIKQNVCKIREIRRKSISLVLINDELKDISKISIKSMYEDIIKKKFVRPTAQKNLEKRIGIEIEWEEVYSRIYTTTIDTHLRMFQYKIVNNILFLNYDLNRFKIVENPMCSLCHSYPETIDHLYIECEEAKSYYIEICEWLYKEYNISLPALDKSHILLGIDKVLVNFIILIYKYSLYKHREKKILLSIELFKNMLHSYERIERIIAGSRNKIEIHRKKWNNLSNAV